MGATDLGVRMQGTKTTLPAQPMPQELGSGTYLIITVPSDEVRLTLTWKDEGGRRIATQHRTAIEGN
ncbi:hypothetical protein [Angustibacter luteus]|uniref:Uncharacterized protein n=1 Tax=Angustibacter luteus TaxID=658456 RepID=A0ABW1JDS5_9ACTN